MNSALLFFLLIFAVVSMVLLLLRNKVAEAGDAQTEMPIHWQKQLNKKNRMHVNMQQLLLLIIVPCIVFGIATLFSSIIAAFVALLTYYLLLTLIYIYVDTVAFRSHNQFTNQLPIANDILIQQLTAGHSLPNALAKVSQDVKSPLKPIFTTIHQQLSLGKSVEDITSELGKHFKHPMFIQLIIILCLHDKTGVDIIPRLERLNQQIEKYHEQSLRVKSATEQDRVSAIFVGLVPFLCIGFVYFVKPVLLEPLLANIFGKSILVGCGFLFILGVFSIYKLTHIRLD